MHLLIIFIRVKICCLTTSYVLSPNRTWLLLSIAHHPLEMKIHTSKLNSLENTRDVIKPAVVISSASLGQLMSWSLLLSDRAQFIFGYYKWIFKLELYIYSLLNLDVCVMIPYCLLLYCDNFLACTSCDGIYYTELVNFLCISYLRQ